MGPVPVRPLRGVLYRLAGTDGFEYRGHPLLGLQDDHPSAPEDGLLNGVMVLEAVDPDLPDVFGESQGPVPSSRGE